LLKGATAEADKVMLTDAPLLFPPGQVGMLVYFVSLASYYQIKDTE